MLNGKEDSIQFDRRNHAVMLDRGRRDLLAWISPDAVESFAYMYRDVALLEAVRPGSAGHILEWVDNNLLLSASRRGWRGDSIERILRRQEDGDDGLGKQLKMPSKGLKNKGQDVQA